MSDDRIASAISNSVEEGNIEELYSLLDSHDVMESCLRSFVSTVNDSEKSKEVFNMDKKDIRANKLVDSLDVYYARWVNVGDRSYVGK